MNRSKKDKTEMAQLNMHCETCTAEWVETLDLALCKTSKRTKLQAVICRCGSDWSRITVAREPHVSNRIALREFA